MRRRLTTSSILAGSLPFREALAIDPRRAQRRTGETTMQISIFSI
jgi:hypothetical protein